MLSTIPVFFMNMNEVGNRSVSYSQCLRKMKVNLYLNAFCLVMVNCKLYFLSVQNKFMW